jgi:hypothetical protein
MNNRVTTVAYTHEDRQWDCRFNVQTDEYLESIVNAIKAESDKGKFKYILISGVEIGTRPNQNDYQVRHVHVAAIFHNRCSKSAILKNWSIKEGNGYYLVPRNRDLPYSGWREHHVKPFSKVDPEQLILFENGQLPEEGKRKRVESSELEKKRKIDEVLIEIRQLVENGKEAEAFEKFPRNFLQYGEKIKAMVTQKRDFFKTNGDPHIWLFGYPGTGKTAILNYIYPNTFKKNLHNKFFDLYDPKVHDHVMLEDLDHEAVERLSINFIKTVCDEAGFAVDQKYKTPQLSRTTVLVTSNFQISDIIPEGKGHEENKAAFMRRFWHVNIYNFLRLLGLKLLPRAERKLLQKEGNQDPGRLFITWNYVTDVPECTPLKKPEDYQQIVKNAFYH